MQDKKSLTLCWHSLWGGSSDIVTARFACKCSGFIEYGLIVLHSVYIIKEARAKIAHSPLTLISRMWQWAGHCPLYLKWQPMLHLWGDVSIQTFDCQQDKTKNCWCSIDAHLKDIVTLIECSTIVRKCTQWLLTPNLSCRHLIISFQKLWGITDFESPLLTLIEQWMIMAHHVSLMSTINQWHIDLYTCFWSI